MMGFTEAAIFVCVYAIMMCPWARATIKDDYFTKLAQPALINGLQILETLPVLRGLGCARRCAETAGCAAFVEGAISCLLLQGQSLGTAPYVYQSGQTVYGKVGGELEILGYRHTAGDTTDAWVLMSSSDVSASSDLVKAVDLSTPLTTAYKHPLFENWVALNISLVTVAFRTSTGDVKRVTFDTTSSSLTKLTWMDQVRIVTSPWSDLNKNVDLTTYHVTLKGFDHLRRRFTVNKLYNGCPGDQGWLVLMYGGSDVCTWGNRYNNYPVIVYSKGDTAAVWDDATKWDLGTDILILLTVKV